MGVNVVRGILLWAPSWRREIRVGTEVRSVSLARSNSSFHMPVAACSGSLTLVGKMPVLKHMSSVSLLMICHRMGREEKSDKAREIGGLGSQDLSQEEKQMNQGLKLFLRTYVG